MSTDIQRSDILQSLALKAQEPTGRADLLLRPDGAYLVPEGGDPRPITPATSFAFEASLRGDRLRIDDRAFLVPYGKGGKAQSLIAEGRIRRLGLPKGALPTPHPLFDGPALLHRLWLERFLAPDEIPLAFLGSGTEFPIPQAIHPKGKGEVAYYLTDRRHGLVAISQLGDVSHHPLDPRPVSISPGVGRDTLEAGVFTWQSTLSNPSLYEEVAPLGGLGTQGRLIEAARLRHQSKDTDRAVALLGGAAPEGIVPLGLHYLSKLRGAGDPDGPFNPEDDSLRAGIATLIACPNPGARALAFAKGWSLSAEEGWAFQRALRGSSPAAALPLHEACRQAESKGEDAIAGALRDLDLAQHCLEVGARAEAQQLLERRLPKLPDESLMDLLPLHPTDLAEGTGGQALRIRLLDLLAEARGEADVPDVEACQELARLQPLVPRRIHALRAVATSDALKAQCDAVISLLEGGWGRDSETLEPPQSKGNTLPAPFSEAMLEEHLQHPATRDGGTFDSLRLWLGKARVPDLGAVRNYAQRLTPGISPAAFDALTDGLIALGLPASIEAFVSRGDRRVGIRAYGGKRPFVLIGAAHLEEGDLFLTPAQLRFLIGAELIHLRFKHTRLTASEVWDGVFDIGSQVVDTSVALIGPLGLLGKTLSGISSLKRAGDLIQGQLQMFRAGAEGAATLVGATRDLKPKGDSEASALEDSVHDSKEELLAFCRSLQLTADRGGLALCGDVEAAVEAMLKSQSHHLSTLSAAKRLGFGPLLARRDAQGQTVEQDLAVRIGALFSFYLSKDYQTLRGHES